MWDLEPLEFLYRILGDRTEQISPLRKMTDMVILNRNPLTMKPNELLGLKVENLLLKGEPYKKGQGMLSLLAKGLLPGGRI
jgi:hypothetical protein